MNRYDLYITSIFVVKIIFVILAIYLMYSKHKGYNKEKLQKIEHWKKRVEFVFISMMSILLIYIFYPFSNRINKIDSETKLLFYLFGFVLLLTERWDLFIGNSIWYKYISKIIGRP